MNIRKMLALALGLLLALTPVAAVHADPPDDVCPSPYSSDGHHAWSLRSETAPTCTEPGSKTWVCADCDKPYIETVPALGHDYTERVDKEPTCTEAGHAWRFCSRCSDRQEVTIPAKGHTPVTVPGQTATCTATGLTEGSKCSVCGTVLTAQQTIPAKGHTWDHGIVTQEPSGFTPGVIYFTCQVCGKQRAEKVDPTEALFDQLRGVTPRSPQENALRIVEQPSDGYASRLQGNHEWQYLKVVAEGGQQPYTYQWYYKPLFTSLGSGSTGSATSDLISWKASGFADAIDRVKGRTRMASSKIMDSWLAAHGLSGVSLSHASTSLNDSGWGGHAIQGATKDSYEAYDIGQYYCVVTDDQGRHVTSRMAKVAQGVYITEQPEDASLYGKTSVALHCAAAGGSGTYEFFLLDKEYNGEGEGDDEMSVGRHIGTEASIPVTRPGKYYFWVDNLVEGGTNGICISYTATVTGDPLAPQPDAPQPGTVTTGTTYGGDEIDAALTGNWFTAYEGMALQLTLNEDGTYAAAFPAQPESERTGTWRRVENALYLDSRTFPDMILEGDDLRYTAFEGVLRREMPETYVPAALQPNAPLESFASHWRARYVAVDGVVLSADALEEPVDVLIEGTDVALGGDLFGDAVASMAYVNGSLTISHDGFDLTLALQQDGFLRLTLAVDGQTVILYLLPYDAAGLSPESSGE